MCEDKKKTISCPESHTSIDVTFAAYGRTSTSVCIHTHLPHSRTDCVRNDNTVLDIVKNKCDGKKNCELEAKNGVFGDTCYGTYKYLEVTFECKSGTYFVFRLVSYFLTKGQVPYVPMQQFSSCSAWFIPSMYQL